MAKKNSLNIILLGGLNEVGKNIMLLEKNNQIIIIDCGLMFPDDYIPGIDFLIPDFSYIKRNASKVKALIMTHGHEDHIGALPYLYKEIDYSTAPIYATRLTLGLIKSKLNENQENQQIVYNEINPDDKLKIGPFNFEFFRVSHSIPDGVGLIIRTDIGTIVHTGDFKFDQNPIDGKITEFYKNAEESGFTLPERDVGKTLYEKFINANKRIIVATFSSHIHRIQQVMDVAHQLDKKVAVVGKTILKTSRIASELGYLKIPENTIIPITKIDEFPINKIVILSTGSQGEPLSALRKMSLGEHKSVKIMKEDMVIISASPIPGNENAISSTINMLIKQGADVFYESIAGVHVSGHAASEEIKMMINLVKPKYFIPIHGEYKHRIQNARLAKEIGIKEDNIIIAQDGDILKLDENSCRISNSLNLQTIYVDGFASGNTGDSVIRDRKILSRNGVILITAVVNSQKRKIINDPELMFKGIIYMENFEELINECKKLIIDSVRKCFSNNILNSNKIENYVNENAEKFILKKIGIKPVIITKVINFNSN